MNRFDWFYGQFVSQADLDESFWWAEIADHYLAAETGLTGIAAGYVVGAQVPPSMSVDVTTGFAYDRAGQRCELAAADVVDCSVDEYGVSTTVTGGVPNSRWLGIFVRFHREASVPKVDNNGVTIYTRQTEGIELFVRQGTEAVGPVRVPILPDALLLADVELSDGTTTVTAGIIDTTRREDWVHVESALVLPNLEAGTAQDAIEDLYEWLNDHVSDVEYPHGSGAIGHAWTETWAGAEALTSATVAAALNEIVGDLAELGAVASGAGRIGATNYTTLNAYVTWAAATIQAALEAISDAIDGHIAGGAPAHPDTAVTSAAQAGVPTSIPGPDLRTNVLALLTAVNARARIASREIITGSWLFDAHHLDARCIQGGHLPPDTHGWRLAEGQSWGADTDTHYAQSYAGQNKVALPGGAAARDVTVLKQGAAWGGCYVATVGIRGGNAEAWLFDAFDPDHPTATFAIPSGAAMPVRCSAYDGNLVVLYSDGSVIRWNDALSAPVWTANIPGLIDGVQTWLNGMAIGGTSLYVSCGAQAVGVARMFYSIDLATGAVNWGSDCGAVADHMPDGGLAVGPTYVYATTRDTDVITPTAGAILGFTTAGVNVPAHTHDLPSNPMLVTWSRCHSLVCDGTFLWYPYTLDNTGGPGPLDALCGVCHLPTPTWTDNEYSFGTLAPGQTTLDPFPAFQDTINIWFGLCLANYNILTPVRMGSCAGDGADIVPNPLNRAVVSMASLAQPGFGCYDGHRIWHIPLINTDYLVSVPFAAHRN